MDHDQFKSFVICFAVAFAPGLIAMVRGHRAVVQIWLVNCIGLVLLVPLLPIGGICLFVALIWSLGSNTIDNQRRDAKRLSKAIAQAMAEVELGKEKGK